MKRQDANLFGLGLHGRSPNVTANKLVNCHYQFEKRPDRTAVSVHGTAGLSLFVDQGDTPWRGLLAFPGNSKLYGVHRGTFYDIDNAGVVTSRGTLNTTSGRVDISDDGTRILVVDGTNGYGYDTSVPATPIAEITDADFIDTANTCTFQGGRFIVDKNNSGAFYGSDAYSVTAWQALNTATAEGNPDNIIRTLNYRGVVVLFGSYSAEYWQNVGGGGFPYAKILMPDAQYGLAARWSVGRFMGSYAFLAQNREGHVIVARLDGYNAVRISNSDLEDTINKYGSVSDATGFGYFMSGHPFYQLNFPNEGKSWLYDGSTDYWSELKSGSGRHRAEIGVEFLNQYIVADYSTGKLYKLESDTYTDNGTDITREIYGKHITDAGQTFSLDWVEIQGETGVGLANGSGSDPHIALAFSKDGGHGYNTEQLRPWGKIGDYKRRAVWRRQGLAVDAVPRITYTQPTKFVLTTGVLGISRGLS